MIHIRQATEMDIPLLARIIQHSFREVADRYGLTLQNCPTHPSNCDETWITRDIPKGVVHFILEHESQPAACVAMKPLDDETCVLERLAVLPEWRKKGFGKALVEHVMKQATERRSRTVTLAIIAQSGELKRWYEALGFVATKTEAFPQLPFEVIFMERTVAPDSRKAYHLSPMPRGLRHRNSPL